MNCNEAEAQTHTALIDKEVLFAESALRLLFASFSPQFYRLLNSPIFSQTLGSTCSKERNPSFLPASKRSHQGKCSSSLLFITIKQCLVIHTFTSIMSFNLTASFNVFFCSPTLTKFPSSRCVWRSFTLPWWLIKHLLCVLAPGSKRSLVTQVLQFRAAHRLQLSQLILHFSLAPFYSQQNCSDSSV